MSGHGNCEITGLRFSFSLEGYQFYTTSPSVKWSHENDVEKDFFPGGSAVYVKKPTIIKDENNNIVQVKWNASPTGSTVQNSAYSEPSNWPSWEHPEFLEDLNAIMNGTQIFKIKNCWQINGLPEYPVWFTGTGTPEKPKISLLTSWLQHGQVGMVGSLTPMAPLKDLVDHGYDLPVAKIERNLKSLAPDMDWFGPAFIQEKNGIKFVIINDSEGKWYCFPVDADIDVTEYSAQYSIYGSQAYKSNVVSAQVKTDTPSYPEWVTPFISHRNAYNADKNKLITKPRYAWSPNSSGTRAISVMISRKLTEATYSKIDYAPDALDLSNPSAHPPGGAYPSDAIPTEVIIDNLNVNPSLNNDHSSDPEEVYVDKRGVVELEFTINTFYIDGVLDFTFEVGVVKNDSPDIIKNLNKGEIVEVAYAMDMDWNTISIGTDYESIPGFVGNIQKDDILSVFVKLYRHKEQIDLIRAYDGEPCLMVPSKAKVTFYKGPDYTTRLFVIPVSQSHGLGHTYTPLPPPALPPPPHAFVWNTNSSFRSLYPFEKKEDCSEELYYYSATITHLDLRTLSFYYTVRLLEQSKGALTGSSSQIAGTAPINNRAKKLCSVVVQGYILEKQEVGHSDLPREWIEGWIHYMGFAGLDTDEELLELDEIQNIRMSGHHTVGNFNCRPGMQYQLNKDSWSNVGTDYSNFLDELANPPWWATGACGQIFYFLITALVIKNQYGQLITINQRLEEGWEWSAVTTIELKNLDFDLESLVDNSAEFLAFCYDAWDTFEIEKIRETTYTDPYKFVRDNQVSKFSDMIPGYMSFNSDFGEFPLPEPPARHPYFAENPFILANNGITKEQFIDSVTNNTYIDTFFQTIVDFLKDITFKDLPDWEDYYPLATTVEDANKEYWVEWLMRLEECFPCPPLGDSVYPRGGGVVLSSTPGVLPPSNFNAFDEFAGTGTDYYKILRDRYIIRNYEIGRHYYNKAIQDYFFPTTMDMSGAIIVTPKGEISYCKKDFFEIGTTFSLQNVKYSHDRLIYYDNTFFKYFYYIDLLENSSPASAFPQVLILEEIVDSSITKNNIDWKCVEYVYYEYGKTWTKHLYLYNLAYQDKQGVDRKTHIEGGYFLNSTRISEEVYTAYYNEEDFKPDFSIVTNSAGMFIHPNTAENGKYTAINNYCLPIENDQHYALSSFPSDYDYRAKRTMIRYSPLFF